MSIESEETISRDEIKSEFQVERMILFSDAVFAIVITLMAIEIRLPETGEKVDNHQLIHALKHLLPVILSYVVSFLFIGTIWYQHLKIFSIVKAYDKGLVVRNLALLFFVGLFPFSASVITHQKGTSISFFIYLSVILACIYAQYFLLRYLIKQKPELRISVGLEEHEDSLRQKGIMVVIFSIVLFIAALGFYFIHDEDLRGFIPLLLIPMVVYYRYQENKRKKRKAAIVLVKVENENANGDIKV